MSLKQKTVSGLIWSFVDTIAGQGITFIISLILARLLSPSEFGLIGMITIFIAISQSFINSGFSNALIRKKDATNIDYSTVFYFNLVVGALFYVILFLSAPAISRFFNEPQLIDIVRVISIGLIISSLTIIQRTILTKRVDFKLQARISVIASSVSGIVAVIMAYRGFGVWALVSQTLINQALVSVLLWLWNRWRPILVFSKKSFNELFGFGSKLLISGLIDTAYRNVYYLIIGKFFSSQELGYYTRAEGFKNLPSQNLNGIISRVTYPVLADIQDDISRLKSSYKKLISSVMFITFTLMIGMAAVAEPMIYTLIGEKWAPSVIYLQMLSIVGMFYPLHALNLNMLQVQGRSDLFLRLEIIKKLIAIPVILIGIFLGIKAMIIGMFVNTLIAYYLNSYWSGTKIGYSFGEQVRDILPSLLLALSMGIATFFVGKIMPFSYPIKLIIQIIFGAIFIILFSEAIKFKEYMFIKKIVLDQLRSFKKKKEKKNEQ